MKRPLLNWDKREAEIHLENEIDIMNDRYEMRELIIDEYLRKEIINQEVYEKLLSYEKDTRDRFINKKKKQFEIWYCKVEGIE